MGVNGTVKAAVADHEMAGSEESGRQETSIFRSRPGMAAGKWWHVPANDRVYLLGGRDEHIWRLDRDLWQGDEHDV